MTYILTDEDLDCVQARADAATAGPWSPRIGGERQGLFVGEGGAVALFDIGHLRPSEPDAEFIAHARDDVPRLLAEIRRLRAELSARVEVRRRPGSR